MEAKYTADDINFMYLIGVSVGASMSGRSGIDTMAKEAERLKEIGKNPSTIIDDIRYKDKNQPK